MYDAFSYFKDHYVMLESDYPYTSVSKDAKDLPPSDCLYSASKATQVKVKDYVVQSYVSMSDLKIAVSKQPVTVAIAANNKYINWHNEGIIDALDCDDNPVFDNFVDHGVLIVGYGHDADIGMDYWLIKNSFGKDWG